MPAKHPRPDITQLLTTLKRGQGRYVPLAELGVHPAIKERFLGRPVRSLADDIDFWYRAGYDYIKLQPLIDFGIKGHLLNDYEVTGIEWAPEGEGVIRSWDDFERFPFPDPEAVDYRRFEQAGELLPEGMGVIGQYGDIFTMVWELMGFEGFSMALFENPELVEALFERIGAVVLSMFAYFAQCEAVDALWYSDDIAYSSDLMISPQNLRRYFFPWLRRIGDLCRAAGKPLIYHTDGVLWKVMEDIIECGVDALHPIEPKAMDIVEVKRRYGERLCLVGNLDVGDVLARGTEDQVRRLVQYNIEQVGYNGGYCVGSGNSIPNYVRFENYLALLQAARDFGDPG